VTRFETTRWSIVLQARGETPLARQALEELCRTYRSPVIAYVRSRGSGSDDAEDRCQAFFTYFIERAAYATADPARGSFRAFLLTALRRFLADVDAHARAQKRAGNLHTQSLDALDDSASVALAAVGDDTPERAFERAWAEAALRAAMRRLQAETAAAGRGAFFEQMCEFLVERPSESDYARVAAALGMRRNTVAVAVHRLRLRLRELVREELADTAAEPDGAQAEFDKLRPSFAALMPSA
jgi:RNA polymerase sigma factor (sigma-70 family)